MDGKEAWRDNVFVERLWRRCREVGGLGFSLGVRDIISHIYIVPPLAIATAIQYNVTQCSERQ